MKEENNVIHLASYLKSEENIPTFSAHVSRPELTPKSHLGRRAIALGVDLLTVGVLKTAIQTSYALFISEVFVTLSTTYKLKLMNPPMMVHALTFMAIYLTYFAYTTYIFNGKTLGKMAMGLTIINENFLKDQNEQQSELTLKQAWQRAAGYLLCYFSFGTFFIFNFSTEDKRGLPDYLSSSRTVNDKWLASMKEFKEFQSEEVLIDIKTLETAA